MASIPVSGQTAHLGPHAPALSGALDKLAADHFLERLWMQDPTLWGASAGDEQAIRERLGWLTIIPVIRKHAGDLRQLAEDLRKAGFARAVVLGMGGSSLFPEVCAALFGRADGFLPVNIIDTTDPLAIRSHESREALERLCVVASSKSGTTIETRVLLRYFFDALKRVSRNPGAQCLAITDCDTPLEREAESLRFRKVFTHGRGTGFEVGGRYSALTFFGLVPAALMGLDPAKLLERAAAMQVACAPTVEAARNPALQLAAALGGLALAGRNKLTLLASPRTEGIGAWIEQLISESTGKQGQGIVPVLGEARRAVSEYGEDRVFVELQLAQQPDAGLASLGEALIAAGHPLIRIRWQDPYDVGGETMKWCIATAAVGHLLGVNPLDEPDVQSSKDQTQAVLKQFLRDKTWPEGQLVAGDARVELRGAVPAAASVEEALAALFRPESGADYAALLSFLPRSAAADKRLSALRERLGAGLKCATLLQHGPRYLHSTGQLFKGGPGQGRFLLLTAEERDDLPIPGEAFTFGQLKRAQALGDVAAMRQKGRRILHVHLRGDLDESLSHLARAVEHAIVG